MCSDNGAQFVSDNTITVCISLEHLKLVKYNIKRKHTTETRKTMTLKATDEVALLNSNFHKKSASYIPEY